LDGGNIASLGLDRLFPGRGRLYMTYASLGLAGLALVGVVRYPMWRPALLVVALIGASNYQEVRHHRQGDQPDDTHARMMAAVQGAEEQAWATGRPGLFPPGVRPSPWFQAHQLLG